MTQAMLGLQPATAEQRALLDTNVPARVAELARRHPRALAVRASGVGLDWEGLERRSNAVAKILHERFGTGDEAISVCGATDVETAVLPLAVIKSGRPYLWLDDGLPLARIRQILSLSRSVGIVGKVSDELRGAIGPLPVLELDATAEADEPPAIERRPEDAACILFTSGSTGEPKGVVTSDRYYLGHVVSYAGRPTSHGHRVALVLPMSFAYGTIVFLRTLLSGGMLVLFDPKATGLAGLADWLDEERAEVVEATPSLVRSLVRTLGQERVLTHLRMVDFGGEPLYGRDVAQLEEHLVDQCQLGNAIGSSELGIFCRYSLPRGAQRKGVVPVGRPEALYEVSVLDEEGGAVPGGQVGEIVVTSRRCSSGYWDRPAQTAARFSVLDDGSTRYRTGDLGRWDDDNLVHLGRADGMAKVRGYLVEPAEVEAALLDSGLVEECAVVSRTVEGEGGSIAAFVVAVARERVSVAALRRSLRQRLPEYLVPGTIVMAEEFPRNANGKIDRFALSQLPAPVAGTSDAPPRTPWERAVWDTFSDILGLEDFGVDDDFFALGGDSLAAEELVTALQQDYGATVTAADLALAPTVASLAERARWPRGRPSACAALRSEGGLPPLFCVAGGGALAIAFVPLVRHLDPGRPVYGLQDPAILGGGMPDWSVKALARRYLKELRKVQPEGPYYLVGHSAGGVIAWEMAQQLERMGQSVGLLGLIDTLRFSAGGSVRRAAFGESGALPPPPRSRARKLVHYARKAFRVSLAGVRPEQGPSQYELFFDHSRVLVRRYHPRPYGGRTAIFLSEVSEENGKAFDWAGLLTGPSEVRHCPGDHLTIFHEPHAESFARELEEVLQRQQDPAPPRSEVCSALTGAKVSGHAWSVAE